jgi:hypothetical protein
MMPTSASLDDWMNPLAALVASIRRDWDFSGIRTAVSKARHRGTPLEVATALLKLARNEALRTPAMLASDGSHWGTPTVVPSAGQPRCTVPGHEHELAAACVQCKTADVVIVDAPPLVLSKAQAAANIQGARDVRAKYVRPAWLDTREDER